MEQKYLDDIKERVKQLEHRPAGFLWQNGDVALLVKHIEQLQATIKEKDFIIDLDRDTVNILATKVGKLESAIKVKDAALAQLSDKENWHWEGKHSASMLWQSGSNPLELAERAMMEGHDHG